jgi:hypothetical protein
MEPLDLESRPPRSAREQMHGVYFLPRTIDKMRAELPGGKPAGYFVTGPNSMSAYVLHKLRIDVDEMRGVVARAAGEDEVEDWLREHVDSAIVDDLNGKLERIDIRAVTPENRALVESIYPWLRERPDIASVFELLETDDAQSFAKR